MPGRFAAGGFALATLGAVALTAGAASQGARDPLCKPVGNLHRLADLPEASGLAVSRASAGRLWAHNDSGAAVLFAVDSSGKPAGRVTLEGARVEDWEALSIGPCGSSSCLYIADIGDNTGSRKHITLYRLGEPSPSASAAKVTEVFQAAYPDGAHDAETLLVAPDGTVLIVTKGDDEPVSVYRFPRELKAGTVMRLERVGESLLNKPSQADRITDGAMSSDGQWVVLRTLQTLMFYRGADFLRGDFKEMHRVDLTSLREPQGEAVAFGPNNTLVLAGEGGGGQSGTLATLTCRFYSRYAGPFECLKMAALAPAP